MTKEYLRRQFQNFKNVLLDATYATKAELADIDIGDLDLTDYAKKTDLSSYATKSDLANIDIGDLSNIGTDNIVVKSAPTVVYDINHLSGLNANSTLENGVLTYICPSNGNKKAAQQTIKETDIEDGVFKVKINIVECIGVYVVFFNYPKKTSGAGNKNILRITQSGTYEIEVDLNYYGVYEDANTATTNISINNASTNTEGDTTNRIVIDKWDILSDGNSELSEFDGKSVSEALGTLNSKIANANTISGNNNLIAPNGDIYIPQITNNGTISYIPKLPSNILYLGNSLLLGWNNRGMAAVDVNGDYYYKVNHYLEEKGKTLTTERYKVADFERFTTDEQVTTWFTEFLSGKMSSDRDLVLIQLGDNVSGSDLTEFTKSCGMLCSYVRENCPNARVAWVDTWWGNTNKNAIIKSACEKYGCVYIHISDLYTSANRNSVGTTYIDSNGVEQTITDQTVANHPNDQGFTEIANRIITTLFE